MIARIAYLTSPKPGCYVICFQEEGFDDLRFLEISEGHLANIVIDGASFALRKLNRVPDLQTESAANERAGA